MAENPAAPLVFVSYSQRDAKAADRVINGLTKAGFDAWVDRRAIEPGENFVKALSDALDRAVYVVLLVSPASMASTWVTQEWTATLAKKGTVLIPAVLEPASLPALLSTHQQVDLHTSFAAGLKALVTFLRRETKTRPKVMLRGDDRRTLMLRTQTRRVIRLVALRCVAEPELSSFCFDVGVDLGGINGASLNERILSLLHTAVREGLVETFADWLERERERCVRHQLEQLEPDALPGP